MRSLLAVFLLLPLAAAAEIKNAAQLQASGDPDVIVANVEPVSEEQTAAEQPVTMQKLQADVAIHSTEELRSLLEKAEKIANGETQYNTEDPIAVVLHGEEIKAFLRSNYRDNKSLVDLAARLDAFNVIDVKVCQRWMGANGITAGDLPPFLEPVPWGAGERKRLQQAGYGYF